jgi:hypothetical protein
MCPLNSSSIAVSPLNYLATAVSMAHQLGTWGPDVASRWHEQLGRGAISVAKELQLARFQPLLERALDLAVAVSGFGLYTESDGDVVKAAELLTGMTVFHCSQVGADKLREALAWQKVAMGEAVGDGVVALRSLVNVPVTRLDVYRHLQKDEEATPMHALASLIGIASPHRKAYRTAQCIESIATHHHYCWEEMKKEDTDASIITPALLHRAIFWSNGRHPAKVNTNASMRKWLNILENDPAFTIRGMSDEQLAIILPECADTEERLRVISIAQCGNVTLDEVKGMLRGAKPFADYNSNLYGAPVLPGTSDLSPIDVANNNDAFGMVIIKIGLGDEYPDLSRPKKRDWKGVLTRLAMEPFDKRKVKVWLDQHAVPDESTQERRQEWIDSEFAAEIAGIINDAKQLQQPGYAAMSYLKGSIIERIDRLVDHCPVWIL